MTISAMCFPAFASDSADCQSRCTICHHKKPNNLCAQCTYFYQTPVAICRGDELDMTSCIGIHRQNLKAAAKDLKRGQNAGYKNKDGYKLKSG